ncbi:unnamed protein product [Acanthosepion pharaonis]|uniref:Uncharacterized protein n=1 Tax=Acanthosepion pharaonis TaxID=158019 RepID=A0A812BIN3_ACAPH|nr:unnamed protein product [Sepia pharaonis]
MALHNLPSLVAPNKLCHSVISHKPYSAIHLVKLTKNVMHCFPLSILPHMYQIFQAILPHYAPQKPQLSLLDAFPLACFSFISLLFFLSFSFFLFLYIPFFFLHCLLFSVSLFLFHFIFFFPYIALSSIFSLLLFSFSSNLLLLKPNNVFGTYCKSSLVDIQIS